MYVCMYARRRLIRSSSPLSLPRSCFGKSEGPFSTVGFPSSCPHLSYHYCSGDFPSFSNWFVLAKEKIINHKFPCLCFIIISFKVLML